MNRLATSVVLGLFALSIFGCSSSTAPSQDVQERRYAELSACNLQDDTSIKANDDLRACDAGDPRKTTICHVPPGNPANRHTLCIGNAAVDAHLDHHDDILGPCESEPPCDDPGDDGGGSGSGDDGGGVVIFRR